MVPTGTAEYTVTDGTIVTVAGTNEYGWNTLGGYTMMLRAAYSVGPVKHGDLFYYAHLDRKSALEIGTRVRVGQTIGYAGSRELQIDRPSGAAPQTSNTHHRPRARATHAEKPRRGPIPRPPDDHPSGPRARQSSATSLPPAMARPKTNLPRLPREEATRTTPPPRLQTPAQTRRPIIPARSRTPTSTHRKEAGADAPEARREEPETKGSEQDSQADEQASLSEDQYKPETGTSEADDPDTKAAEYRAFYAPRNEERILSRSSPVRIVLRAHTMQVACRFSA
jgi:hypothetical protein